MSNHIFKYSGRIAPDSPRHSPRAETDGGILIVPHYAYSQWSRERDIPQYAPTVVGRVTGYDPGGDCQGDFMSFKYAIDNNCYAYACCIATNSFAQPGRASAGSMDLRVPKNFTAQNIIHNATLDGLQYIGAQLSASKKPPSSGHLVALLFSAPVPKIGGDPRANWDGDYHWVRCDDAVHHARWSQKDGSDQVTNFDFSGQPITDPRQANWEVSIGPIGRPRGGGPSDPAEFRISYEFVCFMWVPDHGVQII